MYTAGPNEKFAKLAQTVKRVKLARTNASFNTNYK